MIITEIKTGFWRLTSAGESDTDTLVFFGYSRNEVIGKMNSWLRRKDLQKYLY
jgi:hypothetical protein